MKLTVFITTLTIFQAFAIESYSQKTKLTLDIKASKLVDVMDEIEACSEFYFLFNEKLIDTERLVSVSAKNRDIDEILEEVFRGTNVAYTISDRKIILTPEVSSASSQQQSSQQQITVSGTVKEESGLSLPGVTIVVKGTTLGTITDVNGNFQIPVPNQQAVLQFSFVGFTSSEVTVGTRTTINVILTQSAEQLSEVVVTALGIRREAKTLGYATSNIASDEISTVRTSSVMQTLQGKISGVDILSTASGPGGSTRIRIRGNSSFSGANTPLLVVNGVPFDNSRNTGGSGYNNSDTGDGLTSINPDDIESMTVLKGAAAAALYGSRAKDGVVMITTKQGAASGGGLNVTYNVNFTVGTAIDYTDFQYEYGQGEKGVRPLEPWPTSGVWSFGEKIEPGMTAYLFDKLVPYVANKNRFKQFYRNSENLTQTISFSNGGPQGSFNMSLSQAKNTNIVPLSDFTRRNITLGFSQNISKWITISGNINYSNEYNRNPTQTNNQDHVIVNSVATASTTMNFDMLKEYYKDPVTGKENIWSRFLPRTNPYFTMYERFENAYRDRLFGNVSARLNITDKIYAQVRIGQDYYVRERDYNNPTGTAATVDAPAGYVNGNYTRTNNSFRETNIDFLIGASEEFGDFGFNATFGGNQMRREQQGITQYAVDFVQPGLYTIMNGRQQTTTHSYSKRAINSLYGAAEVSYKSTLYLNLTARNDWFSTLSPDNRSILYPSATASFVFSEVVSLPDWFNFGKFRLSYAEVGDDNVSPYANAQYYSIGSNFYPSEAGNVPVGSPTSSTLPNPNLRPLRVKEWEVGTDVRLFNGRIVFDIAYYNKLTVDQIVSATISQTTGYSTDRINVGESRSMGTETGLTVKPIDTRNFTWTLNTNVSYNTSKVLNLGLTEADTMITIGSVRAVLGKKLGQIYTYEQARDPEGNKIFNGGLPVRSDDLVPIGVNQPTWFGGITNTLEYKGITFSFLIDFKLGKDFMTLGGPNENYYRHGLHKATLVGREENEVVGEGVKETAPGSGMYVKNDVAVDLQQYYESWRSLGMSDPYRANAGYWKLRQMSLGYDFRAVMPKISSVVKGLRLSIVANNVLLLKKWVENYDPENTTDFAGTSSGATWGDLPPTRTIGFNLNVRF